MNEMYRDDNSARLERLKCGDKSAEDDLVRANVGLVRSIAQKFLGRGIDFDDLYQLGMIGLVRAIRSFDAERGCALSTYATPLIIGEIKRFLRDDGIIKVNRESKRLGSRLQYEREKFIEQHGREPHLSEISKGCGIDEITAAEALSASMPVKSIYEPQYEDGDAMLGDTIADPESTGAVTERIALKEVTRQMPEMWRKIVSLRYYHDMSQIATANVLGVSQVKISREEKKIFDYLREKLS